MISGFRYVPHAEVAMYERQGWVVAAHLGPMHGADAVLMRWTGREEPEAVTEAAVEPEDDGSATMPHQLSLLEAVPSLPEGLTYRPEFVSSGEECELVRHFEFLPFREFEFQGYVGKRRVVSFGWQYDFNTRELRKTDDIPSFLLPLRERAATFAGIATSELQHVLLTEYAPGAAIGWHRDKAVFGEVVGISLMSPCVFRLMRKTGDRWDRASFVAEPRSAYLLHWPSRTEWEHSIPSVDTLRYSITFRNFRSK